MKYYESKYTGAEVDALLDKVNSRVVGRFDPSGTYPDLIAGDLVGRGESVPAEFSFRASGGKSIKDGRAYIKRIKGNSVVWNQGFPNTTWNVQDGSLTMEGNAYVVTPSGSYPGITCEGMEKTIPVVGQKVLVEFDYYTEGEASVGVNLCGNNANQYGLKVGAWQHIALFFICDREYPYGGAAIFGNANATLLKFKNMRYRNLTKMFGAGYEPSTIEEYNARKPIVADEYAYNEGQVIHCNTESIKSVGDNAVSFEGEFVIDTNKSGPDAQKFYEEGKVYVGSSIGDYVNPSAVTTYSRYGNGFKVSAINGYGLGYYIRVIPNETYYIRGNIQGDGRISLGWMTKDGYYISFSYGENIHRAPANAYYALVGLIPLNSDNVIFTDITISLYHSGWKAEKDDQYQPYWQDTLPLPIIRKYFPQGMKLAGSAHDEIRYNKASGKWEAVQRIIGVRAADHVRREAEGIFILDNLPFKPINDLLGHYSKNVLMAGFTPDLGAYSYTVLPESRMAVVDDTIWLNGQQLEQYSTAQEYIDALGDTQLYYELAEPIVTEITDSFRDYYNVADFGTEQMLAELPSAPFSADIIYQFNAVDMIREHELEITELQTMIATMQAQLASLANHNE